MFNKFLLPSKNNVPYLPFVISKVQSSSMKDLSVSVCTHSIQSEKKGKYILNFIYIFFLNAEVTVTITNTHEKPNFHKNPRKKFNHKCSTSGVSVAFFWDYRQAEGGS